MDWSWNFDAKCDSTIQVVVTELQENSRRKTYSATQKIF
jgi:hypothetical protein